MCLIKCRINILRGMADLCVSIFVDGNEAKTSTRDLKVQRIRATLVRQTVNNLTALVTAKVWAL